MTESILEPLETGSPCPTCGNGHPLEHSGWLSQPDPALPSLPTPVQMLRCWQCRRRYRADHVPYDQAEVTAAWQAWDREAGQ